MHVTFEEYPGNLWETGSGLSQSTFINIPLKISLFYENRTRVEENDQAILSLITEDPVLTFENKSNVIKFRISKVFIYC